MGHGHRTERVRFEGGADRFHRGALKHTQQADAWLRLPPVRDLPHAARGCPAWAGLTGSGSPSRRQQHLSETERADLVAVDYIAPAQGGPHEELLNFVASVRTWLSRLVKSFSWPRTVSSSAVPATALTWLTHRPLIPAEQVASLQ